MTAPDKIWASKTSIAYMSEADTLTASTHTFGNAVEYTRTDLIPNAAYVAGLEAALRLIEELTDDTDYMSEDDPYNPAHIARAALSARRDAPDTRVVTVAQLGQVETLIRAAYGRTDVDDHTLDMAVEALRAIIGEVK